jgi:UDP-MurNAc hydroxylase
MQLKIYRSATVGIITDNFKMLADPWLVDGEYYGSWSHYPYFDLDKNIDEINSYNAIYISHIHPDHCSEKTLKKIKKNIPIYIHKFHAPFLKKKIENLGFKVFEIPNGVRTKLANNFFLNIFAADDCDPQLCYKFTGCANFNKSAGSQQIDTLSVVDDGLTNILNLNDCPYDLSKNLLPKILGEYQKINILMLGYGGAGPYPQCYDNLDLKKKKEEAKKKELTFLKMAFNFINDLKPDYYLPFAGTYVLSGNLHKLNKLKGVPTKSNTYKFIENELNSFSNSYRSKPLKMNYEEIFDINKNKKIIKTILNEKGLDKYIKKNLSLKKLDYEEEIFPSFEEIYDLCDKSVINYKRQLAANSCTHNTNIYVKIFDKYIKVPYNKDSISIEKKINNFTDSKFLIYNLDSRLLKNILKGPRFAHWNNAEVGSHIKFYRSSDVYERSVYWSMSYFHA